MKLIRVGVDLAKNVFQVHGVDRSEKAVWRRKLTRDSWLKVLLETVEPGCEIVTIVEGLGANAGHTDVMHAWLYLGNAVAGVAHLWRPSLRLLQRWSHPPSQWHKQ